MYQKKTISKNHFGLFFKVTILIIAYFIFMSNSPQNVWGANVYIDPTYSGTQRGTFDKPYNSWSDFTITTGNDYFQKCGTSWTGGIKISNSGTSGSRILVSAYYDDSGVVHESDNPSFGEKCGNNTNKPIITHTDQVGDVINIIANYIELNSIQIKKGETNLFVKGSYNSIQYCRLTGAIGGIRMGLSGKSNHNYIGYNYLTDDDTNPRIKDLDGIQLAGYSNHNIVEYNVVDGFYHAGIRTSRNASYNEIRYNSIYNSKDEDQDQMFEINGDHNKYHHNYGKDCGIIQMYAGDSNEISYNIIDGYNNNTYRQYAHGGIFKLQPLDDNDEIIDNIFYNNIVYDRGDGSAKPLGIQLYEGGDSTGCTVERNIFANNIFLDIKLEDSVTVIRVVDRSDYNVIKSSDSNPDSNKFYNNSFYNWTSGYDLAYIEGAKYATASNFNARADASGNREDDPGLKNPSAGQFWPDDAKDNIVGNGYSLGLNNHQLLVPEETNFTAPLPIVKTIDQPASWFIGAYALSIKNKMVKPEPGLVSGFRVKPKDEANTN